MAKPVTERSDAERTGLADRFRAISAELAPARAQYAAIRKERSDLVVASALVLRRQEKPRDTHIMVRGNFLNPGDKVDPGVPAIFPQLAPDKPADRLALARWLVDPKNPLTARVAVNRFWEQLFSRGIVETSDDFGIQGDPPTHPELLDYLATEFVRSHWSTKSILRLIVTSATYRQSSSLKEETALHGGRASSPPSSSDGSGFQPAHASEVDPLNKLLWHFPRSRADAETIRDIALGASGLLCDKIGGPSVFPPQPDGIWTMIYNSDKWMESKGEDKYRRGLYTFWRRTAPYPTFSTFDAPSREKACTRRPRTNTPLQALTTLNDPQFVEAAGALARRAIAESAPDPAARITYAFRLCTAREPDTIELARLEKLLDDQLATYRADAAAAHDLASHSDRPIPDSSSEPEIAAYTVVANVLLNLDETLTKN